MHFSLACPLFFYISSHTYQHVPEGRQQLFRNAHTGYSGLFAKNALKRIVNMPKRSPAAKVHSTLITGEPSLKLDMDERVIATFQKVLDEGRGHPIKRDKADEKVRGQIPLPGDLVLVRRKRIEMGKKWEPLWTEPKIFMGYTKSGDRNKFAAMHGFVSDKLRGYYNCMDVIRDDINNATSYGPSPAYPNETPQALFLA
ncbi:hypothetical protein Dda_3919 [Drechslerella dactyloides]|uniref:Uncharacterized protein n=1 Tax=Drechslerella dactyloides TaxID=74499 RepID=A0AAD6NIY4_DREDA|nr:hypothetical protein Dda_3919 [Drechslerella dactyloides]